MERKNFFDDDRIYSDEIEKYFKNSIPVTFEKIRKEYNFNFSGMDFEILKLAKELQGTKELDGAVSLVHIKDNQIELYYNNNSNISTYEQRFAIANAIAYCERMKQRENKESTIKYYDSILKCAMPFDDMNEAEFSQYLDNRLARQMLLPKKSFEWCFVILSKYYSCDEVIAMVSNLFCVPEREVAIRANELGCNIDISQYTEKQRVLK